MPTLPAISVREPEIKAVEFEITDAAVTALPLRFTIVPVMH